jgi:ADP-dependent NAD(P)H-hydrate dehydratase
MNRKSRTVTLTARVMSRWALPQPAEEGDKEERGRVLVVGGSIEMPGAVMLAGVAALRAGAGKLRIATTRRVAHLIAAEIPEARVFALPESKSGGIQPSAANDIARRISQVSAALVGPGMIDPKAVKRLMKSLVSRLNGATLVLDAEAMTFLADESESLHNLEGNAVITPHAGEMAELLGEDKESIKREPAKAALHAAEKFHAVVALKGRETFIASPGGEVYCNKAGNVGLATSGSGDTLAGIIAGLAARGASPLQSTAWGVYLHARAGERLAERMGKMGYLARELLAEVPHVMAEFDRARKREK